MQQWMKLFFIFSTLRLFIKGTTDLTFGCYDFQHEVNIRIELEIPGHMKIFASAGSDTAQDQQFF